MPRAIDPATAIGGADEWRVDGVGAPVERARAEGSGEGFATLLADQVGALSELQDGAAVAAQQLATGQAADLPSVVMAVERAQLAMQLAVQVRGKLVDAYQDILHTQV